MSALLKKLLTQGGYMSEADAGEGDTGTGAGQLDETQDQQQQDTTQEKPKPTDAEAKLLKEVLSKKKALEALKGQLAEKESVLSELSELGGLDVIKELVNQKKTAEQKKLEEKGEWDRLKSQMVEEHGKVLKQLREQLTAASDESAKLRQEISNLTVGTSFMSSKFIGDELVIPPTKARLLYGDHFEFSDGRIVGYDRPAGSSERTMLVDANGEALDFESAIRRIVDGDSDRDALMRSKAKPGAASVTTQKQKTPADQIDTPSGIDKISAALAKGLLKK